MPDHPLKTARDRLERAKRQIRDLESSVRKFFELKPYFMRIDKESKPGHNLYKIEFFTGIPDDWPNDVADIANNLRPPLDYAVYRVMEQDAVALAKIKERNRSLPICRDSEALEREMRQRKILVAYPILSDFLLKTVKPYPRGNRLLANLDSLNNAKKHRDLYPIGMAAPNMKINNLFIKSASHFSIPGGGYKGAASKDSVVVFETSSDAQFDGDFNFSVDVALANVDGFERQPLTRSLSQIANEVDRLLGEFDKAFFGGA